MDKKPTSMSIALSDTLKGSYYANPIVEDISVPDDERKRFPEYYGKNICASNAHFKITPSKVS